MAREEEEDGQRPSSVSRASITVLELAPQLLDEHLAVEDTRSSTLGVEVEALFDAAPSASRSHSSAWRVVRAVLVHHRLQTISVAQIEQALALLDQRRRDRRAPGDRACRCDPRRRLSCRGRRRTGGRSPRAGASGSSGIVSRRRGGAGASGSRAAGGGACVSASTMLRQRRGRTIAASESTVCLPDSVGTGLSAAVLPFFLSSSVGSGA